MKLRLLLVVITFFSSPIWISLPIVFILLMYHVRKTGILLLIWLLGFTYVVPFVLFGEFKVYFGFFRDFLEQDQFKRASISLYLFISSIYIASRPQNTPVLYFTHHSKLLYFVSCFFLSILILAPVEQTILNSVSYSDISSSRVVIPVEYGVMFVFTMLSYSNKNVKMVHFFSILFILKYMLLGMRVAIVEVLLIYMLFWGKFQFNFRRIFALYAGVVGMNFFAGWRGGKTINYLLVFFDINLSNATDVFYSSLRLHGLKSVGLLSDWDGVTSLLYLLFGAFIPLTRPDLANLSTIYRSNYGAGGGGLISSVLYVQGGYLAVLIVGLFIATGLNGLQRKSRFSLGLAYSNAVVFMFPRWFAYYPSQLFKFNIYLIIFILIVTKFEKYAKG